MADPDPSSAKKLALLIDADNIRSTFLPIIIREASAIGTIVIKRVYGNFGNASTTGWGKLLHQYALTPVHVPPPVTGKNASDMKLAVEAMDMLHQRHLDGVCIASSDSDFTTLASRIREDGLLVLGFGEKKASNAYAAACDRFFYCDLLLDEEKPQKPAKKDRPHLPEKEILSAIDSVSGEDGWAALGRVGSTLNNLMPDFDPRNYGFRKLMDLVAEIGGLEQRQEKTDNRTSVWVRRRLPAAAKKG